jgi:pimeloyl-ACP methyl ester carboxylesterase
MTAMHASTGGHRPTGDATTVIMIHGSGHNRTVWAAQARHLAARGFDVVALDLPGHGNTPGPAHDSVEGYRDAIIAELDARGLEQVAVAGHSLGAMIALSLAGKTPDRVSHLALLGAGIQLAVNDALLDATRDDPDTAIAAIVNWGHSQSSHVGGSQTPGLWMDGVDTAILRAEAAAHAGSLHTDFAASAGFDGAAAAAAVTARTLVIAGQHDMMTPARMGRAVARAVDNAEYLELEGCGHFMTTERPRDICGALARFFAS